MKLLVCLVLLFSTLAVSSPPPPHSYRVAVSGGVILEPQGLLVTSQQLGVSPTTGQIVEGGAGAEVTQAMNNLQSVFSSAGLSLASSATSCWLYLLNVDSDFDAASAAYKAFFPLAPHPCRSPPGVALSHPNATASVECHGSRAPRRAVSPPAFFATDFNAQGMLLPDDEALYTSGQIGFDPVSETLVPGGLMVEAAQVMSNLDVVFAAAFVGGSLKSHASECQVLVLTPVSNLAAVKSYLASYFGESAPALSVTVGDPGAGASIEVACLGFSPSRTSTPLFLAGSASASGVLVSGGSSPTALVYSSLSFGLVSSPASFRSEALSAAEVVAAVFSLAFPPLSVHSLRDSAVGCSVVVSDAAFAAAANEALDEVLGGAKVLPARSTVVAGLPDGKRVAVRCWGAR